LVEQGHVAQKYHFGSFSGNPMCISMTSNDSED